MTDKVMATKLADFGVKADLILNIDLTKSNEEIYNMFRVAMRKLSFSMLVKFGARTPGPYIAKEMKKPYIIIDGGLPDKFEVYPSLYDKETYTGATKYILTTNFPWRPDPPLFMKNIEVCYFAISGRTMEYLTSLLNQDTETVIKDVSKYLTPFPVTYDLIINLSITNDYVQYTSRTTYGAWLSTKEYDQVVGYIRRLVIDLGLLWKDKKIVLIMDTEIYKIATDLFSEYKNISPITWKNGWDYYTEIALDRISDITISRAANYQPFIFALSRGNNITSAVPADGYMDEDTAAYQAMGRGLTCNIVYDDTDYVKKLIAFYENKSLQRTIAINQKENVETFLKKNNTIAAIINELK